MTRPPAIGMVSWAGVPGGTQNALASVPRLDGAQFGPASDTLEATGSVPGRRPGPAASRRGRLVDPDRTLVDEAAAGNLDAFESLVRRYQTRLVNYVLAIVRDTGEAEDVAQETFIRAYRSLGRFRGESSFKTWLYTIATNTARTALERRGRRERVGDQSLDDEAQTLSAGSVPSGLPDPETTLVTRDAIDRALATLPDDLRVAVVLARCRRARLQGDREGDGVAARHGRVADLQSERAGSGGCSGLSDLTSVPVVGQLMETGHALR